MNALSGSGVAPSSSPSRPRSSSRLSMRQSATRSAALSPARGWWSYRSSGRIVRPRQPSATSTSPDHPSASGPWIASASVIRVIISGAPALPSRFQNAAIALIEPP
jgi:hypothetical protein